MTGRRMQGERILLVEGLDDMHVVRRLSRSSPDMPCFQINDGQGTDKLVKSIRGEVLREGRAAVGIVIDANDDPMARWQAVTHRLRAAGITPPAHPMSHGVIIEGRPRIGVWLMPDNETPGELEDFISRMIPPGDPVWPLSGAYIDSIPPNAREFTDNKALRAQVHAWLATREAPRPLGRAIEAGDLKVDAEVAVRFTAWLRALFE